MRRYVVLPLLVFLAACGPDAEAPRPEPIVVYAPGDSGSELAELFAEFSDDTGILVSAKWGTSGDLTDALIAKSGVPADVLLTDSVADVWRAADEGALRPIAADAIAAQDVALRDPDSYWLAFDPRLFYTVAAPDTRPAVNSLKTIAEAAAEGRLCVASSSLNHALIAMTIDEHGVRLAERQFRRLAARFRVPVLESGEDVLAAIRTQQCDYGIVAASRPPDGLAVFALLPPAYDAHAVGIGRHARSPDSAVEFVRWLASNRRHQFSGDFEYTHLGVAGYRDEEARLLAERVGWD